MLNLIELEDLNTLKFDKELKNDKAAFPLFHGTRRYSLTFSCEEKKAYTLACHKVMMFAKKMLMNEIIDRNTLIKYRKSKIINGCNSYFLNETVYMYNDSSLYEYGSLYLTNNLSVAINYTYNPSGELGARAYHQCLGIRDFNIPVDDDINSSINLILNEYPKHLNSERVLIIFKDVLYKDLKSEDGNDIENLDDDMLDKYLPEYNSYLDFKSFRLNNPQAYKGYVVSERLFKECYKQYTDVTNLDKLAKSLSLLHYKII